MRFDKKSIQFKNPMQRYRKDKGRRNSVNINLGLIGWLGFIIMV